MNIPDKKYLALLDYLDKLDLYGQASKNVIKSMEEQLKIQEKMIKMYEMERSNYEELCACFEKLNNEFEKNGCLTLNDFKNIMRGEFRSTLEKWYP